MEEHSFKQNDTEKTFKSVNNSLPTLGRLES